MCVSFCLHDEATVVTHVGCLLNPSPQNISGPARAGTQLSSDICSVCVAYVWKREKQSQRFWCVLLCSGDSPWHDPDPVSSFACGFEKRHVPQPETLRLAAGCEIHTQTQYWHSDVPGFSLEVREIRSPQEKIREFSFGEVQECWNFLQEYTQKCCHCCQIYTFINCSRPLSVHSIIQ